MTDNNSGDQALTPAQRSMIACFYVYYKLVADSLVKKNNDVAPQYKLNLITELVKADFRDELKRNPDPDVQKVVKDVLAQSDDPEVVIGLAAVEVAKSRNSYVPFEGKLIPSAFSDLAATQPTEIVVSALQEMKLLVDPERLTGPQAANYLGTYEQNPDGSLQRHLSPLGRGIEYFIKTEMAVDLDWISAQVTRTMRNTFKQKLRTLGK